MIDPPLAPGVSRECTRVALEAFGRLGCRDVGRFDFIVSETGPWFLYLKTMTGFKSHSLLPMAAARHGLDMPRLCETLVEAALARGGESSDRPPAHSAEAPRPNNSPQRHPGRGEDSGEVFATGVELGAREHTVPSRITARRVPNSYDLSALRSGRLCGDESYWSKTQGSVWLIPKRTLRFTRRC